MAAVLKLRLSGHICPPRGVGDRLQQTRFIIIELVCSNSEISVEKTRRTGPHCRILRKPFESFKPWAKYRTAIKEVREPRLLNSVIDILLIRNAACHTSEMRCLNMDDVDGLCSPKIGDAWLKMT